MKRCRIAVFLPLIVLALSAFALTDQALAASGSIAGTVTDAVTHVGIADIQIYASLVDQAGPPAAEAVTTAGGAYVITGLEQGTYIVQFWGQDGSEDGGDFAREYYNDDVCQDFADPVVVASGASVTGIDAALSGWGTIHGRVEGHGGVALPHARVQAFCRVFTNHAWEWEWYPLEWQDVAPSGDYVLERVRIGQWALAFADSDGVYASEYYPDAHFVWDAQTVLVTPGSNSFVKGDLDLGGTLRGHVFNSAGAPLEGVTAALYDWNPDTQQWGWAGLPTPTGPDGSYQLRGLDTWKYRLQFIPPDGSGLASEYWYNSAGLDGGLDLTWGIGQVREGYDAWLGTPDAVAPATSIAGLPASAWSRLPLVLTLTASDAGSGVELTRYRLDEGAWTAGTAFAIAAPSTHANDGLHVIEYRSADYSGNWEGAHASQVNIDTIGPATRALAKVAVAKGKKAGFRLRVDDRTPTAAVTIKIFKGKKLAKQVRLGQRATNAALTYRWKCTLAKGSYSWKVYATDLAGNRQLRVGGSTLRVR